MSDPATVNETATLVNKAIKAAMDGGSSAVLALIVTDVPWLGLPVIRQILAYVLSYFEGYLFTAAANAATSIVIDLQVEHEASKTKDAFQGVVDAVKSGDQQAIEKSSSALDDAFSSLIHSDGSASP